MADEQQNPQPGEEMKYKRKRPYKQKHPFKGRKLPDELLKHRFQPGQSGNPCGRPKVKLVSQAIRARLASLVPDDPLGRTYAEKVADAIVDKAMKGQVSALSEAVDRAEGKALQSVNVNASLLTKEERMADVMEKLKAITG